MSENLVIVAAAGSRKTQYVVESALAIENDRALVITFTEKNQREILDRITAKSAFVPRNISVVGWFHFLINDCAKPYQRLLTNRPLAISGLNFVKRKNSRFISRKNIEKYFFDSDGNLLRDRVSDFVCLLESKAKGAIMRRLSSCYSHIFIDEFQDLAGYDLDVIELLMKSNLSLTLVGDPRQRILRTNLGSKNSKYNKPQGLVNWLEEREGSNLRVEERCDCYRSNQAICDYADALFPTFTRTKSQVSSPTDEEIGVFPVRKSQALDYYHKFRPTVIRDTKRTDTCGLPAMNVGIAKGQTFSRVLLFPPKTWLPFFKNRDPLTLKAPERLYVALTRASHSVAFVVADKDFSKFHKQ